MDELIACCGVDCATCDARIATIKNDDKLRKEVAEKWRALYGVSELTAEMINCTGCRTEGVKIGNCLECEIRKCVQGKGYATCGDCPDIETCPVVAYMLDALPQAKSNLLSLKK